MMEKYNALHPGAKFLIKAILLITLWKLAYVYWIYPHTSINAFLTDSVGNASVWLLEFFGEEGRFDAGRYLYVNGIKSVIVDHSCNGLELHALFLGFLIIAPGKLWIKGIYAVGGVLLIYLVNVVRVYLLGMNHVYNPEVFDFNHKYLYLGAIYLVIFALWMVWLEVFAKGAFQKK